MQTNWEEYRRKIIGLGENSFKKSYYPELQAKIDELEASKLNFETVYNSTSDAIMVNDLKGNIISMNHKAQVLYNLCPDEFPKYTIHQLSSPNQDLEKIHELLEQASTKGYITFEWIALQVGTGKEINVQVSLSKTKWNKQDVLVSVIRDFTERKEYEQKLLEALEKAEESDKLKTAFLQNMSHEIRTPLNAILGFSNFLADPDLSEDKRKQFVSIIQRSSNQLVSIVSDILTISSLETNQERINLSNVCINTIMLEVFEMFKPQANNQDVALYTKQALNDVQCEISTDKTKLVQILSNLISNALKYTKEGFIEFGYTLEGDKLLFHIKDTGEGIHPQYHSLIFERFAQAESTTSSLNQGTGLGLAISKAFIELLGGEIWFESKVGVGSTFFFSLPYNPVHRDVASNQQSQEIEAIETILIAEDEEYNYLFLEEILKELNVKKIHAKNGEEAVRFFRETPHISLILMDIKMPVMNGFQAAKQIKAINPSIPIIAQSAHALKHEISEFRSTFDDYVTKPIRRELLLDIIKKYI